MIATGGSVAYSERAMKHLQEISHVIFLEVSYEELTRRISNFESRGIAKTAEQSFQELFEERQKLYKKYADFTVKAENCTQEEIALNIAELINL